MKAITRVTILLATGCAFALIERLHAQPDQSPLPSGYYSANDPELPPLPFNPHPELSVVEVWEGVFLVDDTSIPDTPEQTAAKARRLLASQRTQPVDPRLVAAAQEVIWKRNRENLAPWLQQDARAPGVSPATLNDRLLAESLHLTTLQQKLAAKAVRDRAAVEQFCAVHGITSRTVGLNGSIEIIAEIENGIPRIPSACNAYAADTIGTDELWPGGNTGLNLTGTNLTIGLWDAGDAREHVDLGFWGPTAPRLTDIDGASQLGWSFHATHVAGTLAATGISPLAKGMAYQARLLAWDFVNDAPEMAGAVVMNNLRICNHS